MNSSKKQSILFVTHEESLGLVGEFRSKGDAVFPLDGAKIASKDALLRQLASAMEFPDYFGNNWDSLEECLRDLQWLSARGYVIQFANADRFIEACPSDSRVFLQIIDSASRHWRDNNVDFILIIETSNPGAHS